MKWLILDAQYREAGGIASLSGAMPIPVSPANGHHLTLDDVKKHTVTSSDEHYCPTRLICLENTLGGTIMPLKECQAISSWAKAQDPPIAMHIDGARLWEAVAGGEGTLKEYSECFDSVTMCFSKGLGAPIGSIILADQAFIKTARHLRKMMGGGLRMAGVVTASARVAVDETFMGGQLTVTHQRAREVAGMWEAKGGQLAHPVETNMVWLDIEAASCSTEKLVEAGVKEGLNLLGGRIVVHYQISEEAVARLGRVMDAVLRTTEKELGGVMKGVEEKAGEVLPTKEEKLRGATNGVEEIAGEVLPATEKEVGVDNGVKEKAEENMAPEME